MIRFELQDDEIFFKTLRDFIEIYADSVATGLDFKAVLEEIQAWILRTFSISGILELATLFMRPVGIKTMEYLAFIPHRAPPQKAIPSLKCPWNTRFIMKPGIP